MFDHDVRDRGKGEDDWRVRLQRSQEVAAMLLAEAAQEDGPGEEENGTDRSLWEEMVLKHR